MLGYWKTLSLTVVIFLQLVPGISFINWANLYWVGCNNLHYERMYCLDWRFRIHFVFVSFEGKKGAVVNQLKKVGEVKVSSPEDRKAGEAEMHQRTSRYCVNRGRSLDFRKLLMWTLTLCLCGCTLRHALTKLAARSTGSLPSCTSQLHSAFSNDEGVQTQLSSGVPVRLL